MLFVHHLKHHYPEHPLDPVSHPLIRHSATTPAFLNLQQHQVRQG